MNITGPRHPNASQEYVSGKNNAIFALSQMTSAMRKMSIENIKFHDQFADVQKRLENMKEAYGGKELDVEVIRSKALDMYISESNLPKVTALGHFELEKALKDFYLQEKELDEKRKKTVTLVESLVGDRHCKCGEGHGARA